MLNSFVDNPDSSYHNITDYFIIAWEHLLGEFTASVFPIGILETNIRIPPKAVIIISVVTQPRSNPSCWDSYLFVMRVTD